MSAPKLIVFVAFKEEFKRIHKMMKNEDSLSSKKVRGELGGVLVDLIQTGIGPEASAKAAKMALNELTYKGCVVYGYCGGLSPRVHVNDIIVASKLLDDTGKNTILLDEKLNDKLGKALVAEGIQYKSAPLITKSTIIEKQEERLKIFKDTKAEAVDMEAFEIAKLANLKKLPVFVLKSVADDIHIDLPEFKPYFKSEKVTTKEVKKALKNQPEASKIFKKNMKSSGEVLQKAVTIVTSIVENYWSQL